MAGGHKFLDTMNINCVCVERVALFLFTLPPPAVRRLHLHYLPDAFRNEARLWSGATPLTGVMLYFLRADACSLLRFDSSAYWRQARRGHPKFISCYAATAKDLLPRSGLVTQFSEWNMFFFAAHPCRLMREREGTSAWARGRSSSLSLETVEPNILQILPWQFCLTMWSCGEGLLEPHTI